MAGAIPPRLLSLALMLVPLFADGATYYVAKSGSNSSPCGAAQSPSTPRLTINAGAECLNAGDTLVVQPGTYQEALGNVIPSGTPGNPTIVRSAMPRGAVIQPGSNARLYQGRSTVNIASRHDITLDGFTLDGAGASGVYHIYLQDDAHHLVIQNNEIKNGRDNGQTTNTMGIVDNHGPHHITIRNNHIHHMGTDADPTSAFFSYGMYVHISDSLIADNEVDHASGHGIHAYNTVAGDLQRNVFARNRLHDNGSRGMLLAGGTDNRIEGNVIERNGQRTGTDGLTIGGYGVATVRTTVVANTITGHAGHGLMLGSSYSGPVATLVRNNRIAVNVLGAIAQSRDTGTVFDDNGPDTLPHPSTAPEAEALSVRPTNLRAVTR